LASPWGPSDHWAVTNCHATVGVREWRTT